MGGLGLMWFCVGVAGAGDGGHGERRTHTVMPLHGARDFTVAVGGYGLYDST